jgi:hypothetical protein
MQRCKEQAEENDHQAAEPRHRAVDLRVELGHAQQHSLFELREVLLGGDVVVDRVEDFGRDALGLLPVDIGVGQGISQGKPVGQRRLRVALRI